MRKTFERYEADTGVEEVLGKITFSPAVAECARDSQDPEVMLTDGDRIEEFIEAYQNIDFSDEGRFTLMFVILDSFNDVVMAGDVDLNLLWEKIKRLLTVDGLFYSNLVIYYASVDYGRNLEDAWPIAPYMRSILIDLVDQYESMKEESDTPFLTDWDYLPEEWNDHMV